MRFEFDRGGRSVGSAQWEGPGQVRLDVSDTRERAFLQDWFASEVTYLATAFDEDDEAFQQRRRDWTPWEFERACHALEGRGYRARRTPSEAVEAGRGAS